MKTLIFDCDGVLVDTEKDGHRAAFNEAFKLKGLGIKWGVGLYGELLKIAGGKERMRCFFSEMGWPVKEDAREDFISELHKVKTECFMKIIKEGRLPLRSGVARLVDEAIDAGISLAVCSTSNGKAVNMVIDILLGRQRKKHFKGIYAGDIVSKKKPDPEIYLLARDRLGIDPKECVVIEDSRNGLLAAKGAGMNCIITKSEYTGDEDFTEADLVFPELGDLPGPVVDLDTLSRVCES